MKDRFDEIQYPTDELGTTLFLDGPAEFLVASIAKRLSATEQWFTLFGEEITPYRREDYSERSLPALRIYNENYTKQFDSWFIEGDIFCDILLPASIRREQTQQIQDSLSAALLQQFRRITFFEDLTNDVPGLNELGKTFSVDKSLGFEWNETVVPLTQMTVNFRIDLRQWDLYLEKSDRTKDRPFERTLGDWKRLVTHIQALRDDFEQELQKDSDQKI